MDDDLDMFDSDVDDALDRKGIGEVVLLLGLMSRYGHDGEKFRDTYRQIENRLRYLEKRIASLRAQFDTFPKPKL